MNQMLFYEPSAGIGASQPMVTGFQVPTLSLPGLAGICPPNQRRPTQALDRQRMVSLSVVSALNAQYKNVINTLEIIQPCNIFPTHPCMKKMLTSLKNLTFL
jgi:hypothetical protein